MYTDMRLYKELLCLQDQRGS